jgi:L-fuculose-phosphate aldolase
LLKRKKYLLDQLTYYCQRLDDKGFVANHDGNLTVRFNETFLATPTAQAKAVLNSEQMIVLDGEGKKLEGLGNPFSEIKLHLAAYRARPNVNAVIHAHPPYATARGLAGMSLFNSLPEAVVSIGAQIPVMDYLFPGDSQTDDLIGHMLSVSDVFMMKGNGVLAVGENLEQAYLRLELLEHVCKIDSEMRNLNANFSLPADDVQKLQAKHLSLFPKQKKIELSKPPAHQEDLKSLIAGEVKKIFGDKL